MPRLFMLFVFLIATISVPGQKLELEAEVLLQSRHLWRGSQLGDAVAIEPSVTLGSGHFNFNLWAAKTIDNSYSEIDLIAAWQFKKLAVTLLDYYNPVVGEQNQFLHFQKDINRHSLELTLDNYAGEKRRVKWMIGTFLLGDRNELTGRPFYSTYIELKYPFTFLGIEAESFTGLTPFRGYYADQLAVINSGLTFGKEFDFNLPFTFPLSLSFIYNPDSGQRFVIFAGGIAF